jgi:hypothetical protein
MLKSMTKGAMSNKKRTVILAAFVCGFAAILLFLYFYAFVLSVPGYENVYFTPEHLSQFATVEQAFEHFVRSLATGDAEAYQDVLGRALTPKELRGFTPYSGKTPRIQKIARRGNQAFVVTDNGWGEFFEQVRGRWVFTPEDLGANVRSLFAIIK